MIFFAVQSFSPFFRHSQCPINKNCIKKLNEDFNRSFRMRQRYMSEEWMECLGTYRQTTISKEPVTDYSSRASRIIKISSFVVIISGELYIIHQLKLVREWVRPRSKIFFQNVFFSCHGAFCHRPVSESTRLRWNCEPWLYLALSAGRHCFAS